MRIALVAVLVVACAAAATAAPLDVRADRSDNTFYFTYESGPGRISDSTSSARFVRKDPVSFHIYVTEAGERAEKGKRLRARFAFELNKRKAVRYRGTFTLEVRDSAGAVVYTDDVERKIVLRPSSGNRKKSFSVRFDLPTGSYEARALFKSS